MGFQLWCLLSKQGIPYTRSCIKLTRDVTHLVGIWHGGEERRLLWQQLRHCRRRMMVDQVLREERLLISHGGCKRIKAIFKIGRAQRRTSISCSSFLKTSISCSSFLKIRLYFKLLTKKHEIGQILRGRAFTLLQRRFHVALRPRHCWHYNQICNASFKNEAWRPTDDLRMHETKYPVLQFLRIRKTLLARHHCASDPSGLTQAVWEAIHRTKRV